MSAPLFEILNKILKEKNFKVTHYTRAWPLGFRPTYTSMELGKRPEGSNISDKLEEITKLSSKLMFEDLTGHSIKIDQDVEEIPVSTSLPNVIYELDAKTQGGIVIKSFIQWYARGGELSILIPSSNYLFTDHIRFFLEKSK